MTWRWRVNFSPPFVGINGQVLSTTIVQSNSLFHPPDVARTRCDVIVCWCNNTTGKTYLKLGHGIQFACQLSTSDEIVRWYKTAPPEHIQQGLQVALYSLFPGRLALALLWVISRGWYFNYCKVAAQRNLPVWSNLNNIRTETGNTTFQLHPPISREANMFATLEQHFQAKIRAGCYCWKTPRLNLHGSDPKRIIMLNAVNKA